MIVIRKPHIRIISIVGAVPALIPQHPLDGRFIGRPVPIPEHGAPGLQMGQHPRIDRIFFIGIDVIGVKRGYRSILLDHPFLFCKIIVSIFAVYLHIEGKLPVQHRILVVTEHQREGSPQQSQRKQGRQRPHGKLHRPHLGGKLPEQEQILSFVDRRPAFSDIADDKSRQSQIEKIDRNYQTNQKVHHLLRARKPPEHLPEQKNKKD